MNFPFLKEENTNPIFSTVMAIRDNKLVVGDLDSKYTREEVFEIIRDRISKKYPAHKCFICGKIVNPSYRIVCDDVTTPKLLEKAFFCRRHRFELIAPMFNLKVNS